MSATTHRCSRVIGQYVSLGSLALCALAANAQTSTNIPAPAQTPIPALVAANTATANAANAAAPALGTLFYSPDRRAALERQRQYNIMEARAIEGATLKLDGVVSRSSGKTTVWVNGRPSTERDAARTGIQATVSQRSPGSAVLGAGDDQPTALKVGEEINRGTGERNDRLGGGAVVANPRR
jgi:hypothetical protein